jgi:hypothetical protein
MNDTFRWFMAQIASLFFLKISLFPGKNRDHGQRAITERD